MIPAVNLTPLPGVLGEVARFMMELEAHYHELGWDHTEPTVLRLDRSDAGQLRAAATPLSIFDAEHPHVALEMMRLATTAMAFPMILRAASPLPPVGTLFALEAISGPVESRQILGLVGRHTLCVARVRDHEPELLYGKDFAVDGQMYHCLVAIHKATMAAYRIPLPMW